MLGQTDKQANRETQNGANVLGWRERGAAAGEGTNKNQNEIKLNKQQKEVC